MAERTPRQRKGHGGGGSGTAKKKGYTVLLSELSGSNIVAGGEEYYLYTTVHIGGQTFCTPLASKPVSGASDASASPSAVPRFTTQYPNPVWEHLHAEGNQIVFYWSGSSSAMPDAEFTVRGKPKRQVDEQRRALCEKTEAIAQLLESSSSSSSSDEDDGTSDADIASHNGAASHSPHRQRRPQSQGRAKRKREGTTTTSLAAQLRSKKGDPFAQKAATPSSKDPFFGYSRVRLDEAMLRKSTSVRLGIRGPKDESLLRLHGTLGSLTFTIDYAGDDALEAVAPRDDLVGEDGNQAGDEEKEMTVEEYLEAERRALAKEYSHTAGSSTGATGAAAAAADRVRACCALTSAVFYPLDPVFTTAALDRYHTQKRAKAEAKLARRKDKLEKLEKLDANTKTEWWQKQRAQDKAKRAKEAEREKDAEAVEGLIRGRGALGRLLTAESAFLSLQLRSSAPLTKPSAPAQGTDRRRSSLVKKEWQRSAVTACPPTRSADPTQKVSFREQQAFRKAYLRQVLRSTQDRQPPTPPDPHSLQAARTAAFQWDAVDALLAEADLLHFEAEVGLTVPLERDRADAADNVSADTLSRLSHCPAEALCVARGPLLLRKKADAEAVYEAIVPCYAPSGASASGVAVAGNAVGPDRRRLTDSALFSGEMSSNEFHLSRSKPQGDVNQASVPNKDPEGSESDGSSARAHDAPHQQQQQQQQQQQGSTVDENEASQERSGFKLSFAGTAAPSGGLDDTMMDKSLLDATATPAKGPHADTLKALLLSSGKQSTTAGLPSMGARPVAATTAQLGTPCGWLVLTLALTDSTGAVTTTNRGTFDVDAYMSAAKRFIPAMEVTLPAVFGQGGSPRPHGSPRGVPNALDSLLASGHDGAPAGNRAASPGGFKGQLVKARSPTTAAAPAGSGILRDKHQRKADVKGGQDDEAGLDSPDVAVELPNAPPGGFVVSPLSVELTSARDGASKHYMVAAYRSTFISNGDGGKGKNDANDTNEEIFTTLPAAPVDGLVKFPSCVYMVESCGPALGPLRFDVYECDAAGKRLGPGVGSCRFDFAQLPYVGKKAFDLSDRAALDKGTRSKAAGGPIHLTLQWNISPEVQQGYLLKLLQSANPQETVGLPTVEEINAGVSPAERRRKRKKGSSDMGGSGSGASDTGSAGDASSGGSGLPGTWGSPNQNKRTRPPPPLPPVAMAIPTAEVGRRSPAPPAQPQGDQQRPVPPPLPVHQSPVAPQPPSFPRTPPSPQAPRKTHRKGTDDAQTRPKTRVSAARAPLPPPPRQPYRSSGPLSLSGLPGDGGASLSSGRSESRADARDGHLSRYRSTGHGKELALRVTVLSAMNLRQPAGELTNTATPSCTIAPYAVVRYEDRSADNYSINLPLVRVGATAKNGKRNGGGASTGAAASEVVTWNFTTTFTVPSALATQPFQLLTCELRDGHTRQLFGSGTLSLATPGVAAAAPTRDGNGNADTGEDDASSSSVASSGGVPAVLGQTETHVVPVYRHLGEVKDEEGIAARQLLRHQQQHRKGEVSTAEEDEWMWESIAPCVGQLTVLTTFAPKRSLLAELFESDGFSRTGRGEVRDVTATLCLSVLGGVALRAPPQLPVVSLRPYLVVNVTRLRHSTPGAAADHAVQRQRQYRSATAPAFAGTNPLWYMEVPPLVVSSPEDRLTFTVFHAEGEGFDVVLGEATLTVRALVERALAAKATLHVVQENVATRTARHSTPPQLLRLPLSLNTAGEAGRDTSAGALSIEWHMQRTDDWNSAAHEWTDGEEGEDTRVRDEADDTSGNAGDAAADHVAHVVELGVIEAQGIALPAEAMTAMSHSEVDVIALVMADGAEEGFDAVDGPGATTAGAPTTLRNPFGSSLHTVCGQLRPSDDANGDVVAHFSPLESTLPLRLPSRMEPVRVELYARVFRTRSSVPLLAANRTGSTDGMNTAAAYGGPTEEELNLLMQSGHRHDSNTSATDVAEDWPFTLHFLGETTLQTGALDVCAAAQEPVPVTLGLRPRRDPRYRSRDIARANQCLSNGSSGGGFGGLGFLTVRVGLYTLGSFDARVRQQLRQQGIGYTVQVQVRDTADFAYDGVYVVEVKALGAEETAHRTRPARGLNPTFQQQSFLLYLQKPTELVEFRVLRHAPEAPGDRDATFLLAATTTLTITGPAYHSGTAEPRERGALLGPGSVDTAPPSVQSSWLTLTPVLGRGGDPDRGAGVAPKLFVRWRIVSTAGPQSAGGLPALQPERLANVYGVPVASAFSTSTGNAAIGTYVLPPTRLLSLYESENGSTSNSTNAVANPLSRRQRRDSTQEEYPLHFSSRVEVLSSHSESLTHLEANVNRVTHGSLPNGSNRTEDENTSQSTVPFTLTVVYGPTGQLIHFTGSAESSTAQDVMLYCRVVAEEECLSSRPRPKMALYTTLISAHRIEGRQRRGENDSTTQGLQRLPLFQPLSRYVKSGAYVQMLPEDTPVVAASPLQADHPCTPASEVVTVAENPVPRSQYGRDEGEDLGPSTRKANPQGAFNTPITVPSAVAAQQRFGAPSSFPPSPARPVAPVARLDSDALRDTFLKGKGRGLLDSKRPLLWLRDTLTATDVNVSVMDVLAHRTVSLMDEADMTTATTNATPVTTCVLTLLFAAAQSPDVQCLVQQFSSRAHGAARKLKGFARPCLVELPEPNATRMVMGYQSNGGEEASMPERDPVHTTAPLTSSGPTRSVEAMSFFLQAPTPALMYAFLCEAVDAHDRPLVPCGASAPSTDQRKASTAETPSSVAVVSLVSGFVPLFKKDVGKAPGHALYGAFPLAATAEEARRLVALSVERDASGAACVYEEVPEVQQREEGIYVVDGRDL